MTRIQVLDYGFGNVRSMVHALSQLGVDAQISADPDLAMKADGLVIPGVGAYGACMAGLRAVGGDRIILDRLAQGLPVLGVCIGLQVMFQSGDEDGRSEPGLGLIPGRVTKLDADVVPHMGWDHVQAPQGTRLLAGVQDQRFYFVHSYAAMAAKGDDRSVGAQPDLSLRVSALNRTSNSQPRSAQSVSDKISQGASFGEPLVTWATYGRSRFVAAYECGPLSATQFHPEKSGQAGARLLTNWVRTLSGASGLSCEKGE
ncbi:MULTISPECIES: imidazole glycerol phosphate synthase subunit HisH [Bifidobacterium]|uniref:Imidazole glycerol phosphate synthase subunit HisH n=1 Tax=Bifidobacterium asteroides TaxID=1684 RepID=A0A556RBJ1_9BIFI|nr:MULTISPECIES: imidazole glycerol phosphate synthase subunit HisH [Bifidobacterium]MBI0086327.1 imidazole glycerol phosphate synthase subunit HisH [Bifidobacterium sp. M0404]TSJ86254.1 imidazole glycerol phosphate synthase subunit HisH [Bifidobacterium polysaccharolyticum]